ncbi:MAG: YbjN domain-containing protein [Bacteroidales bacterium]|nr:YbjN domain-containing protein [Bacteroidales bacterium]MCF8456888.1 YbjN domain-containing protein [Bacteroidales bacterium]
MDNYYLKVKEYLLELEYNIVSENEQEAVFLIEKEDEGITNVLVACNEPILIIESHLFDLKEEKCEVMKRLLQINRDIVHGAFSLDDTGKKVIFRDTLQLENLDLNELQGSLYSLILLLSEYRNELIKMSK